MSLTRYRNRVRVSGALQRLEDGERNLAALAADLGFADQAHLCRTIRAQLDHTPTALRCLLGPGHRASASGASAARHGASEVIRTGAGGLADKVQPGASCS